ncbi:MAG: hypothetical protein ACI8XW_003182 [Gammaproteobacteria bacterium]|jgi:hypothetical protein
MKQTAIEVDAPVEISRRKFLKTGTGVLIGTLAIGSGVLASLAPSRSWALSLNALSESEGDGILKVTRGIFPHDRLDDAVYALVVKDLDAAAAKDATVAKLLRDGLKQLNKLANGDWASLDYLARENLVIKMADTDFFEKIRGTSVVSLYNNEMAWAHFGYEGSSFEKGGYFNRGFQDLDWLPDPSAKASPAKS